jgi:hypothetical protein
MTKKFAGYIGTIFAALTSMACLGNGQLVLALLAVAISFSSNYYAEY